MKIRNPFFLPFALAVTLYVAAANHYGWSLMQTVATNTWQRFTPNTQHK